MTYTDGVEGAAFAEQRYEVETGGFTPAFDGTPARAGYTFNGWDKTVSALVLEDTTYTATWTANTYVVTLEANGGELSGNTLNVTFDAPVGALPVPALAGHTFLGWFDANGNAVTAETLYHFAGDTVLTAKWSENAKPSEPNPSDKPSEKPGTPATGDSTKVPVLVTVLVLSVAAICLLFFLLSKKKHAQK